MTADPQPSSQQRQYTVPTVRVLFLCSLLKTIQLQDLLLLLKQLAGGGGSVLPPAGNTKYIKNRKPTIFVTRLAQQVGHNADDCVIQQLLVTSPLGQS